MARKDTKTATKRKESPTKDELETKRAKTVDEQFEGKNPSNVIGGLKSTLINPNVSEEAREHAEQMLDAVSSLSYNERINRFGRDITHLMAGYKTTFERADASEQEKKRAQDIYSHLEQHHTRGGHLGHVIGGYKAALSNDNVSEEAKQHAREMLDELGAYENYEYQTKPDTEHLNLEGKDITHVIAGYKGTLTNANVSEEAKEHARKMLDDLEGHHKAGRHLGHVMAGYKATLSNANTSFEAKEHARRVLKEMGAHEYDYSFTRDERLNKEGKDITHVIAGYKGVLSRDNVSEEAKEHARRVLSQLEEHHTKGGHLGHVIGGYRAALSNANVSDEAKDHARRMLEELGAEEYEYAHYEYKNPDFRGKNFGNVIGGYKSAIHNPNVSDEAKEHAREVLAEVGVDENERSSSSSTSEHADFTGKNPGNVLGGYKATVHNPNSSEEAKEHAREILAENGVDEDSKAQSGKDSSEKDPARVAAGIKAAIHNPNVSEETKDELRNKLDAQKIAH